MTPSEETLYNRICNELYTATELGEMEIYAIAKKIVEKCKSVLK